MPTTGEPTTGLLITALTVSLLLGAAAGWAVRNVRWWVVMLAGRRCLSAAVPPSPVGRCTRHPTTLARPRWTG
jgi:hypothetical protein